MNARQNLSSTISENLANLLYEIGNDRAQQQDHTEAVYWLQLAQGVLTRLGDEGLYASAEDLRVAILHSVVKSLAKIPGEDNREKAQNIVDELDTGDGSNLAVLLMKLDLYDLQPETPPQIYTDTVRRLIHAINLSDSTISTVLYYAHNLRDKSSYQTHYLLKTLFIDRLIDADNQNWIEKLIVTMIWNATVSADILDGPKALEEVFDALTGGSTRTVGAEATHASQMVRWIQL